MKTLIPCLALLGLAAIPAAALEVVHSDDQSGDVYLAPAPWADPDTPPSPPAMRAKAVATVGAINNFNSASVAAAYNAYYNLPEPAVNFTGSVAGCNAGTISLAFQEWTITRINYLRAMAGVPGNTTLDSSLDAQQQAAALIMSANNTLTHSPSPGMACYTALGASGAGSSNIALGSFTDSIPLYMSDPGTGNEAAGHRRWILHSAKTRFGLGQTTPPGGSALYTFDAINSSLPAPNGIPWPPRGYVPIAIFPTAFTSTQRWSFGLPGANFGSANVTLARNGVAVPVTVISRTANGYGDNTIVWELPNGHSVTAGSVYDVSITGVSSASGSSFSYQVLPFNPASNSADLALSHVAAPATGGTGKDVVYTLNVANAGPVAAANIALTDTLPPGTTLVWMSPGCVNAAGTVTCSMGTLASGTSRQVKLVVRPTSATPITNNASVSSGAPDSNPGNNASSASTTISASPAGLAIFRYRLYSPVTKEHHFTTDLNEYNVLGANGNWSQEGTSGRVLNNPGVVAGVTAVPYYRLYNNGTAWHHWTTDVNEYYTLSTAPGWNAEGVDGYILPSFATGTTQLYRLLYPAIPGGLHHWTIDANEYNTLITPAYGWIGEGGSGFVLQ